MHKDINVNVSGPAQPSSTYKTVVLKGNLPFALQVTEPNTKYVIKHNFDLGDGSVTIPEGCLLEFDGGSISDGTLICNETILVFDQEEEDILKNVELLGDYDYSAGGNGVDKKDNINGMATITLKKNKSFASQLTQTNTIYRIMYDFDLNDPDGENPITIPANCVLEFDGGSLSNGTITGKNTVIKAGLVKIFNGIIIVGTWIISVAYAKWFGNKTSDIQKAINSFVGIAINVNGDWVFDTTVTVPYNTSLICDRAECYANVSGTILKFYVSDLSHNLNNFIINLGADYSGTCIHVYGCNHSNIEGYNSRHEAGISASELRLPAIKGASSWASTTNQVIGLHIHGIESNGDILYYKTIHSYGYALYTHVRVDATSGINSCHLDLKSFFCRTGLSLNSELGSSVTVRLCYQCYAYSYKAIAIDNNATSYKTAGGCTYNIDLWDPENTPVTIDNSYYSIYKSMQGLGSLGQYFNNKFIVPSWTGIGRGKEVLAMPEAIQPTISNVYLIQSVFAANTHLGCIQNIINYLGRLNLGRTVVFEWAVGSFNYIDSSLKNVLQTMVYNDGDTPIVQLEAYYVIRLTFYQNNDVFYKRFMIEHINYSYNKKYTNIQQINYDSDGKTISSLTDGVSTYGVSLKRVVPLYPNIPMSRPTLNDLAIGFTIFDTSLSEPRLVTYKGNNIWVDATGTTV
jgi:hypothetical protein